MQIRNLAKSKITAALVYIQHSTNQAETATHHRYHG